MRVEERDHPQTGRILAEEERLALLSALQELTVQALDLFQPESRVSDFMLRLAERLGCSVALCLEARSERRLELLGAAGLARASTRLPLPLFGSTDLTTLDWSALPLPYPELARHPLQRWLLPMQDGPNASRALILFFKGAPPLTPQLTGLAKQLMNVLQTAFEHRAVYRDLLRKTAVLESESEASTDGILVIAPDDRVLSFNSRFREMWSLQRFTEPARGEGLLGMVAGRLREPEGFLGQLARLHANPLLDCQLEIALQDGRTFECFSVPVDRNHQLFGRAWYFRDVTERIQRDLERSRLLERERQARAAAEEAVRARQELLSNVSHELRTPLTPLAMRLHLLLRNAKEGKPADLAMLEKANRSLDKLSSLVDDLLDFSRIQEGRLALQLQPCHLNRVLRDVVEQFRSASPRHRVVLEEEGELFVNADPGRLEQVFVNLLDNAIKYSPGGGTIRITLRIEGGEARLEVADPGIGIPADQLDNLFNRYFRAHNARTGTYSGLGLGLFITRDIVQRHGGRIWVDSEVGRGSRFQVALPLRLHESVAEGASTLRAEAEPTAPESA